MRCVYDFIRKLLNDIEIGIGDEDWDGDWDWDWDGDWDGDVDSDWDGIPDHLDACPTIPENWNGQLILIDVLKLI